MDSPIATININIGMGKDNPVLKIRANDNISALVDQLIEDYQLPKKVHAIIMNRVHQQIPQTPKRQIKNFQSNKLTSSGLKRKSMSPLKMGNLSSARPGNKKSVMMNKENNPNVSNCQTEATKNVLKKDTSLSPLKKNNTQTVLKKIEIKTNKIPSKNSAITKKAEDKKHTFIDPSAKHTFIDPSAKHTFIDPSAKIAKLFKKLTKNNPPDLKIMSPQFVNLKGLDKNLLGYLQDFFENLEQHEFDIMDQSYFILKTEELGFKQILAKRQFECCYLD